MNLQMIEGIIEHGQVKLLSDVRLPENTKVYVIVPEARVESTAHIYSPRLKHSAQAKDFTLEVVEVHPDAKL
jgi:predicted DNA-binding antitoxin AbrB/MazE fold protein